MRRRQPTGLQYDLFGEIEAAETVAHEAIQAASVSAVAFIVETPWPELLAWWLHTETTEARLDHGETKASYRSGPDDAPGWAWATWRDGLRFEPGDQWSAGGGWSRRPRWCIPWPQLRAIRESRSDVTKELSSLAAGRGSPHSLGWRWWIDPHVLCPRGAHPSYLCAEQEPDYYNGCERPETAYRDRLAAWDLALGALRTASVAVVDKQVLTRDRAGGAG